MQKLFDEIDKLVGLHLLDSQGVEKDKLVTELSEKYENISKDLFEKSIEKLLSFKILIKNEEGKLLLNESIKEKFRKIKELEEKEEFRVKIYAIIEIKAITEELVKKEIERLKDALKKEQDFIIFDVIDNEPREDNDGYYSAFIETTVAFKSFRSLMKFMIFYAPVSIDIIKPSIISFDAFELQNGLLDLSEYLHLLAEQMLKLMNRKELEDFYSKLLKRYKQR